MPRYYRPWLQRQRTAFAQEKIVLPRRISQHSHTVRAGFVRYRHDQPRGPPGHLAWPLKTPPTEVIRYLLVLMVGGRNPRSAVHSHN